VIAAGSAVDTGAVGGVGDPIDDRLKRVVETSAAVADSANGLAEAAAIELGVANEQRRTDAKSSGLMELVDRVSSCAATRSLHQWPFGKKRAGVSCSAFPGARRCRHEEHHRSSRYRDDR